MITDTIVGFFIGFVNMLVNLLPAMPDVGQDGGWKFIGAFNYLLPVEEFVAFLPVIASTYAALGVFRIVRLLNPLGS